MPEKHAHSDSRPGTEFRPRSREVSRIEAFSDVVFGFSLTLLVVSLEVPRTFTDLLGAMRGFVPFAVCFAVFAQVWWLHHNFFRRYGLDDIVTATLNPAVPPRAAAGSGEGPAPNANGAAPDVPSATGTVAT